MWPFVALVVLLLVNGFFVALEFALVGSRRSRLEPLAAAGDRRAIRSLDAMRELGIQLAGAQLGITVASLLIGLFGEPATARVIESAGDRLSFIPHSWVGPLGYVLGLLVIVFAHMVIGEMVPKNLTLTRPEATLRRLVATNRIWLAVARPFVRVLTAIANSGVRAFGVEPTDELPDVHTVEELQMLVSASHEEGAIPDLSAELLSGVLDFAGQTAGEIMVPGDEICAVPIGATVAEIEGVVRERAHTRVLVLDRQRPDRVVGFVHSKDLLMIDDAEIDRPLPPKMVRRNLSVGADEPLESLLLAMQRRRIHVAVIVDGDGAARGMVTLDDLLERLVRDITDEMSE
jgi:CBS domain containing-hemolysin-like protein